MIDLHSHTTASDGALSPRALCERARAQGVTTLAITDHDTVAGLAEAAAHAGALELVAGIEISTRVGGKPIHVLGLFVDPEHAGLKVYVSEQLGERRARMERMVANLARINIRVDMADVDRVAGGENLCRPHLARVLVQRNIVRDMQDAFNKYLGDDRPGYSPHRTRPAEDAIRLIHEAGGVASLAHPAADGIDRNEIEALAAMGLDALEVFRPDQAAPAHHKWLQLAEELALVPTGGSDYHDGPERMGAELYERRFFEALRARRAS